MRELRKRNETTRNGRRVADDSSDDIDEGDHSLYQISNLTGAGSQVKQAKQPREVYSEIPIEDTQATQPSQKSRESLTQRIEALPYSDDDDDEYEQHEDDDTESLKNPFEEDNPFEEIVPVSPLPFRGKRARQDRDDTNDSPPVDRRRRRLHNLFLDVDDEDAEGRERNTRARTSPEGEEDLNEDVEKAADRLLPMLEGRFKGCGRKIHQEWLLTHEKDTQGRHFDLGITYAPDTIEQGYVDDVGLDSWGFPTKTGIPRAAYPDTAELQNQFEGTDSPSECPVPHVCLHTEELDTPRTSPLVRPDVDSLIIVAWSLGVFKRSIRMCFVYDVSRNLKSGLHLPIPRAHMRKDGTVETRYSHLEKTPHLYAGVIDGWGSGAFYFGFPRLATPDSKNNYIKKEHMQQFYDRVLHPALQENLHPSTYSSFPTSHVVAELNARARDDEERSRTTGTKQMQHFDIGGANTTAIWEKMQSIINDEDNNLGHLKEMFVFFDVKNMKSYTETSRSDLYQVMEDFDERLSTYIDDRYVTEMAIDLAVTITAPSPKPGRAFEDMNPAVTYFWKRCCIEADYDSMVNDGFDNKKGSYNIYTIGNLYDAACIGVEPPKHSYMFRGGLRYLQRYSQAKIVTEANGQFPLNSRDIVEMCVDDSTYGKATASTNSTHARSRSEQKRRYAQGKNRLSTILQQHTLKSYGLRFEIRGTSKLWRAIKRKAKRRFLERQAAPILARHPESAWAVNTRSYIQYLRGNYNKYLALIEMCSTTSPSSGRGIARSRFMHILIVVLQCFLNSELSRHSALWKSEGEQSGVKRYGLGFGMNLKKYGYAWFRPDVVDWNALQFNANVGENILGMGEKWLLPWFQGTNALIQGSADIYRYFEYLEFAERGGRLQEEVMLLAAHYLFRLYRKDVWLSLHKEVRSTARAMVDADSIPFCIDALRTTLSVTLNCVNSGKVGMKHPKMLFHWLWTDVDEYNGCKFNRNSMKGKAYYQTHMEIIQVLADRVPWILQAWYDTLYKEFFRYHWVVLYPNPNGAFIAKASKKGSRAPEDKRQLYAVRPASAAQEDFIWAKDRPLPGTPPAYPQQCDLRDEQLSRHMSLLRRRDELKQEDE